MNKKLLAILLFVSMIFVLYPTVDALSKAQSAIAELNEAYFMGWHTQYNDSFDYARNLAVLQIVGFVFLYLFLGIGLHYLGRNISQQTGSAADQTHYEMP